MKIIVIGNCQARPLGELISRYTQHDVLDPIILHLSKDADQEEHMERIAQADLVLAQATAPVFQPAHLRSDIIKQSSAHQVVIWPNVFFVGQHPYLRYLTHVQLGRILGPMDATHDIRLVNDWFESRQGILFNDRLNKADYEQTVYDTSLRELRGREENCDLIISDLIEANFETQRLFFTFNHPSLWLLTRLAERILEAVGEGQVIDATEMGEPLGRFRPSWCFSTDTSLHGVSVDFDTDGKLILGAPRKYNEAEFKEATFACYDALAEQMDVSALRITPHY